MNASSNWSNAVLQTQLRNHSFDFNIKSWKQQRAFAEVSYSSVPDSHSLKTEWGTILNRTAPSAPPSSLHSDYKKVGARHFTCGGEMIEVRSMYNLAFLWEKHAWTI
eukprot:SAG31_NODE_2383_length_5825_cov_13.209745_6_plen_107_part_00